MNILHLTLKKKWFDMIASGEKKEEYREIKPYWDARLWDKEAKNYASYDVIEFKNGYSTDAPTMQVKCKCIRFYYGRKEWGADPNVMYYVIELGKIISIKNYTRQCGS